MEGEESVCMYNVNATTPKVPRAFLMLLGNKLSE